MNLFTLSSCSSQLIVKSGFHLIGYENLSGKYALKTLSAADETELSHQI